MSTNWRNSFQLNSFHVVSSGDGENKLIDLQNANVKTAGAYVCIHGSYLFAIGIRPYHGRIPIFRVGGHRQEHETGWQCAVREVYEEASLQIKPLPTKTTLLTDGGRIELELERIRWQTSNEEPVPLLVTAYLRNNRILLSLIYLAHTEGSPAPSSEVKGLLLLEKEQIHQLCREPVTLEEFLSSGGRAILNGEFDTRLVLEPFLQLRLLSKILSQESEIELV